FGSFAKSVSSGTLACILYAISYWAIRVAISGSPKSRSFSSFSAARSSSWPRRTSRLTPSGLLRYRTGSPLPRNLTPWKRDGRKQHLASRRAGHGREALAGKERLRHRLAVLLLERRLVVEQIDVRRRAVVEQVDHAPGLRRKVRQAGEPAGSEAIAAEQGG